jgi:DNA-binding CsgD family transcriptional regulator
VSYMKKRCESRWIDDKRRQSVIRFNPLSGAETSQAHDTEDPAQLAERSEAIQIFKEAELSLSPRERRIYQLRAKGLSPNEIRQLTPGLSYRTYRKLIERANKRVKAARSKIESGQRCEELNSQVLREFIAGAGPAMQMEVVKAHLEHCRRCQQRCTRLRDATS